jgi:MoxR-like ATPase
VASRLVYGDPMPPSPSRATPPADAPSGAFLAEHSDFLCAVKAEVGRVIVGQAELVEGLLIGLLADGHVLLEGLPGLAKSLLVQSLAQALGGSFRRVQFTPDLLPSDLTGTQVFDAASGKFHLRLGPVFANLVLADEINRAPAKVQSALLEAMQERQVSVAGESRPLPNPFLVLATQNPVELEGTYRLPEAQVDRFMLKLLVDYPTRAEEKQIMARMAQSSHKPSVQQVGSPAQVLAARAALDQVYVDDKISEFVLDLVSATRQPANVGHGDLAPLILYGASPRASIALVQAGRAKAFLAGRAFVLPEDIKAVARPVLRHRLVPSYEAEAEGHSSESLLETLLDAVRVP